MRGDILLINCVMLFYMKKKLIIVAHRLVTVKNYDEIFFIDKGKITKQGHLEEVLSNI